MTTARACVLILGLLLYRARLQVVSAAYSCHVDKRQFQCRNVLCRVDENEAQQRGQCIVSRPERADDLLNGFSAPRRQMARKRLEFASDLAVRERKQRVTARRRWPRGEGLPVRKRDCHIRNPFGRKA